MENQRKKRKAFTVKEKLERVKSGITQTQVARELGIENCPIFSASKEFDN